MKASSAGICVDAIGQWRAIKKPCAMITVVLSKLRNGMVTHEPAKKKNHSFRIKSPFPSAAV